MGSLNRYAKRVVALVIFQAWLCALETYLILKISLIGRVGIAVVYREYRLLRSGWKTFLLLFLMQFVVIITLEIVRRKAARRTLIFLTTSLIVAAVFGLTMTYLDFLHTYSHRLLKERFHLGFYLFWLAWIGSCIAYLADKEKALTLFESDPGTDNAVSVRASDDIKPQVSVSI